MTEPLDTLSSADPAPVAGAGGSERFYTYSGIALIAFIAVAGAIAWKLYPVFVDTYYHMAVISGFEQAGGVATRAFWEMAPGGRVHIYPPSLHTLGYLFTLVGVTPRAFITVVSWALYPACMLTTWLWIRRILGARAALFAVALLCGPSAFFWNQSAHTANALLFTVAPLALLALERERFLLCGVLNFVAITAHPMGLFLPPALVITALLRRKRLAAGLLAASVPVVLYLPWLAHVWANKALIAETRTGGSLSLGGHGVNLGLFLAAAALLGIPWMFVRRGPALVLIGVVLGFAIVFPIGFGGRFFMFNIHWPLACLGGLGLAETLRWLEGKGSPRLRSAARLAALAAAVVPLIAFPSLDARIPREGPRRAPPPGGSSWHAGVQASMLARLFDGQVRLGPGPGPGGGMDVIHRRGAGELFDAVRRETAPGDVIFVPDPPVAALVTGLTGRWASGGMLRDVYTEDGPTRRENCDFMLEVRSSRPSGMLPGRRPRGGRVGRQLARAGGRPPGFEKVFENETGSLWRNEKKPEHNRTAERAVIPLSLLLVLAAAGLILCILDFLPGSLTRSRRIGAVAACVVAAICLGPLALEALGELRNPPPAPPPSLRRPVRPPGSGQIFRIHERVLQAVRDHLQRGEDPDFFWPPGNEDRLRRFMEGGDIDGARELLQEAVRRLEKAPEPADRTRDG